MVTPKTLISRGFILTIFTNMNQLLPFAVSYLLMSQPPSDDGGLIPNLYM
ncbi:hypothetical protein JOC94_000798 [Bacillus thermophilus]|uniref:Uncharacterized protein n=1 Tax=Siminovitchia thermophila TaxID=1245522 RepID=A0ABS2R2H3_9BACI|nr:hypothetical protein [Siminovitchia thermophila]